MSGEFNPGNDPAFWEEIGTEFEFDKDMKKPLSAAEAIRHALADGETRLHLHDPDTERTTLVKHPDGIIEEIKGDE